MVVRLFLLPVFFLMTSAWARDPKCPEEVKKYVAKAEALIKKTGGETQMFFVGCDMASDAAAAACMSQGQARSAESWARTVTQISQLKVDCDKMCEGECEILMEYGKTALAGGRDMSKGSWESRLAAIGLKSGSGLGTNVLVVGGAAGAAAGVVGAAVASGNKGGGSPQPTASSSSSSATSPTVTAAGAVDGCSASDSYRFTQCDDQFIKNCVAQATDTLCTAFATRYCATGAQSSTGVMVNGQLADKTGQGVGSAFCSGRAVAQFCAVAGRTGCPSCGGASAASLSSQQIAAAKTSCPGDPIFMNPQIASASLSNPSSTLQPSSVTRSVQSSELVPQSGPSLFAVGSRTIQGMCSAKRLNCP